MKPTLASAVALGCVTAALVATAGNSRAAPAHPDRRAASISEARTNAQQHAGVAAGQGLVVRDTVLDADGVSHVRFERTYHGLEVVGGDFVVHQAKGGTFRSVSGRSLSPFQLPTTASVTAKAATAKAASVVGLAHEHATHDLVVLAVHRAPTLAWQVNVTGRDAEGPPPRVSTSSSAPATAASSTGGHPPRRPPGPAPVSSTAPSRSTPRSRARPTSWSTRCAAATRRTTGR